MADLIAARNFATQEAYHPFYADLNANQKAQVEALLANILSYHPEKSHPVAAGALTAQQLDKAADTPALRQSRHGQRQVHLRRCG